MSLRDLYAEKYKSANKLLDEYEIKRTKGEEFNSCELEDALFKIVERQPPHEKIYKIMDEHILQNEKNTDEIMDIFNNELNEDLQFITIELLKLSCRFQIVYNKSINTKFLNNVTKLIEMMEKSKKY